MSQPSTIYSSQSTFKKVNNQNDYRSRVRDTARKFDITEKSNDSPPSPVPSHHSSVAIQVNNNTHTNETSTSASSASSDSLISEYIVNQNTAERKRSATGDKSTLESSTPTRLLTKPHISTARIQIRPLTQHKPTPHVRRKLPPIPQSLRASNEDEEPVYVNSDNGFGENVLIHGNHNFHEIDDEDETESFPSYAKPILTRREILNPSPAQTNQHRSSTLRRNSFRNGMEKLSPPPIPNRHKTSDAESIGLEINEPVPRFQRQITIDNGYASDNHRRVSSHDSKYERTESPENFRKMPPRPPPPPAFAKPFLQHRRNSIQEESQPYVSQRSFPASNFMLELGALLVVFIICMVLASAIRQDETKLRTTMQIVYAYVYLVSIIWMIWCMFDILKFRRQWAELTSNAHDHDEYMDMTERHSHHMFYFPDIHNTGGLFMRVGAGLLCMGGLILTVIEIAITITKIGSEPITSRASAASPGAYSSSGLITKFITYILRFIFHCVQYSFLFRYGNLVINRYHLIARIGLIHLVIANFSTWFEAIVIETLEQLHETPDTPSSTTTLSTTVTASNDTPADNSSFYFIKTLTADDATGNNKTTLEVLYELESSVAVYLYPCLIEYSLIALTVFFIMWRNVGKDEKRSFLRFGDRHVFTVNCARASRGLLIGGIIFLLTIVTLIPTYLFDEYTTSVTHITRLVLLVVSLFTVCLSYFHITKLFYDRHAHVDIFDQVLIIITTVGDFAYSFFGLFASIFLIESNSKLPVGVEISFGILAIFQTFLQSGFIMDALKRRTRTKQENRIKPGRETITALLLMNLAIWMHDSLSAKKVQLNPSQVAYYNTDTWAIIQAFTSPLSIFYRFHSSVCLADIWQEVYHVRENTDGKIPMTRLPTMNGAHDN